MVSMTSDKSKYKGIVGPLYHRCSHCQTSNQKLFRCTGCLAVRYCSREHQVAHRPQHKSVCTKIKKARAKLAKEDHAVRNATEDFVTPANAFETHVGRFWGLRSTRDYMRARLVLVEELLRSGTLGGVHENLEHMLDMLRLCRGDNIGLRDLVPAVMLRLDLDQECYDFVKWWATCNLDRAYDWGDMTLPYLDIHGADAFEDPGVLFGDFPALNQLVAILILKMKLLVDIHKLQITRKILSRSPLPIEIWKSIELAVVRSPLSTKLQKEASGPLLQTESTLLNHIRRLGAALVKANSNFMFNLFEPDEALCSKPQAYSRGSWEEMALAMKNSYAAWWETEGVLDLLNDARACAARDSEDEIEDLMKRETLRSGTGSRRTAKKLLEDVSVNRIWGYLDFAAENACYLRPWSERPSGQHTRESREIWARAVEEDAEFEDSLDDDEAWSDDED